MIRRLLYGISLWVFLATIGMTLAAIVIPEWITWTTPSDTASKRIHYTYGLHSRCSSLTETCKPFPEGRECYGPNAPFCSAWRTAGFLMSFAVIIECASLVCYLVLLAGGKQKRERGWPVLCVMLVVSGAVQCAAMAIVVDMQRNDPRFIKGWRLGTSWILCTLSWTLQVLTGMTVMTIMSILPHDGGYELIPDREVVIGE